MMWNRIKLPYIFERMLAFSIPMRDCVLVLEDEALHFISLSPELEVTTDKEHAEEYLDIYDNEPNIFNYRGKLYKMLGLYGGEPILSDIYGNQLNLDAERELLEITDIEGKVIQEIQYFNLSGDWAYTTFSPDGEMLAIGVPYDLFLFRRSLTK